MAALNLRQGRLEIGATARMPYGKATEGTVLAQDPPAHAQGIERPGINLLVATAGDDVPDGFVMPDLTGMPVVSAQAELARVGLKTVTPSFVDMHVMPVGAAATPSPDCR